MSNTIASKIMKQPHVGPASAKPESARSNPGAGAKKPATATPKATLPKTTTQAKEESKETAADKAKANEEKKKELE